MADTKYAAKLLDRLKELDFQTVEAYYDMGSIISSMQHGKLYQLLGYKSMKELVEEELTYTPSTAARYATMYRDFRRLNYLKHEAVALLKTFGLKHMGQVLPSIKTKVGKRAIKNRVDALDDVQLNFSLTKQQLEEAEGALVKMGAMKSDSGRWINSTEAFMHMVNNINAMNVDEEAKKLRVVK